MSWGQREAQLRQQLESYLPAAFIVALSGGLDSVVLLHLLTRLVPEENLRAVHVNHGLFPAALQWQQFCEQLAQQWGIPLQVATLHLAAKAGESLEASARYERYAVLEKFITADDILVTAHHQADQAETLLLQLIRGAGVQGLAAMPMVKSFNQGKLLRPLLNWPRRVIRDYAEHFALRWVEDPSNKDTSFARNFIRQDVMPLLTRRWPSVDATLSRSAQHCAEAQALINEVTQADFKRCFSSQNNTIDVTTLQAFSVLRQRQILRHWVQHLGYQLPSTRRLQSIQTQMLSARHDAMPSIVWDKLSIRRYAGKLYTVPEAMPIPEGWECSWDGKAPLKLPGGLGSLRVAASLAFPLQVRFRQGGEILQYRGHHRSLKKLWQTWQVPPWQRGRVPLLFKGLELLIVVGYGSADSMSEEITLDFP